MTKYTRETTHPGFTNNGTAISATKYDDTVTELHDEGIPQIDDVDTLQALNGSGYPDGKKLWLQGYDSDRDGGEGIVYKDSSDTTTSDNGGTVFVDADGVRWKRPINGYVNVKWFGAKGDGSNDDYNAVQASIESIDNNISKLIFPKTQNSYLTSQTWHIEKNDLVVDLGGSSFSVDENNFTHPTSTPSIFLIGITSDDSDQTKSVRNVKLENGIFDFPDQTSNASRIIYLRRCINCNVKYNYINNSSDHGITLAYGYNNSVEWNIIKNPANQCVTSLLYDGSGDGTNRASGNYYIANNYFEGASNLAVDGHTNETGGIIEDNYAKDCYAFCKSQGHGYTVRNNTIDGVNTDSSFGYIVWVTAKSVVEDNKFININDGSRYPFGISEQSSENIRSDGTTIKDNNIDCTYLLGIIVPVGTSGATYKEFDITGNHVDLDTENAGYFIRDNTNNSVFEYFHVERNTFNLNADSKPGTNETRHFIRLQNSSSHNKFIDNKYFSTAYSSGTDVRGIAIENGTGNIVRDNYLFIDDPIRRALFVGAGATDTKIFGNHASLISIQGYADRNVRYHHNTGNWRSGDAPENDKPLTNNGDPNGSVLPRFTGDTLHDTSTSPNTIWEAVGATNSDWVALN